MKEIYLITSYTPTSIKQDLLRNLVNQLERNNKSIMISSHSHTSDDIVDKCNYYIFDPENELIKNPEYQVKSFFSLGNNLFKFVDLETKIHTIPVLKSLCTSFSFLKSLEYDIVHWLEYDNNIIDFSIFDNNTKQITSGKYDLIAWETFGGESSKDWLSVPVSFNLNKLNFNQLLFNKEKIMNDYKNIVDSSRYPFIETLIVDIFFKDLNMLIKDKNDYLNKANFNLSQELFVYGRDFTTINIHNDNMHFVHCNKGNESFNNFDIIVSDVNNNQYIKTVNILFKECCWLNLEIKYEETKYIKIYKNGILLRFFDFINNIEDRKYIEHFTQIIPFEES